MYGLSPAGGGGIASAIPGVDLSADTNNDLDELLDKLINRIWNEKGLPDKLDKKLIELFAAEFTKAMLEGLADFINTEEEAEQEFIAALTRDVWQFSAAKTYSQMKDITRELVDATGKLRTYKDFKFEAGKINEEYTGTWLKTEYTNAIIASQMAAKWQRIQQEKETLPYLKYVTVGDERVREEHAEMEGIIRKVDDDFWLVWFPPNGWRCRCDVLQLSNAKETDLSKRTVPDIPSMFQFNPGISAMIFPPGHPYYDGLPDGVQKQIDKLKP